MARCCLCHSHLQDSPVCAALSWFSPESPPSLELLSHSLHIPGPCLYSCLSTKAHVSEDVQTVPCESVCLPVVHLSPPPQPPPLQLRPQLPSQELSKSLSLAGPLSPDLFLSVSHWVPPAASPVSHRLPASAPIRTHGCVVLAHLRTLYPLQGSLLPLCCFLSGSLYPPPLGPCPPLSGSLSPPTSGFLSFSTPP